VVATVLVGADLAVGETIYHKLKEDTELVLRAAMWWFDLDAGEWRYFVAADYVSQHGPRAAYLRIHNLLSNAQVPLPLSRIVVVAPDNQRLQILRRTFKFTAPRPMNLTLQNVDIPGLHIEGAHIYNA
jgi:hypothetical protein